MIGLACFGPASAALSGLHLALAFGVAVGTAGLLGPELWGLAEPVPDRVAAPAVAAGIRRSA
jgi:hypothetical protein